MSNLHVSPAAFKVAAFYKFADFSGFLRLKPDLAEFCCARGIRGTIILAEEGINGTVAGTAEAIDALMDHLNETFPFQGAELKFSQAEAMPFLRMKVRVKEEIVTLRAPEVKPSEAVGTYVAAEDWNALIGREDVVLLDTRNDYEAELGTFEGAIDPHTRSFVEFKDFVARNLDPERDRKVAMFCTGGIRCEKASAYLLSKGFEEVFHLKGGILKYLETVPEEESRWQGECFVFDERVSVTHGLAEGDATLCRGCRRPLTAADRAHPDYREGVCCAHCADAPRSGARERQRQIEIARSRGERHMGDEAAAHAQENLERKKARRQASQDAAKAPVSDGGNS